MSALKQTSCFYSALMASSGLLLVLTLLSFLGASFWFFELLTVFRFYFFFTAVLLLALCLPGRVLKAAPVILAALVLNAAPIWPSLLSQPPASSRGGEKIKLLLSNLYKENNHYEKFLHLLAIEKPDVIGVVEFKPHWRNVLLSNELIHKTYPFFFINLNSETAVFSRYPLLDSRIRYIQKSYSAPSILQTQLATPTGRKAGLVLIHPPHSTNEMSGLRQEKLFDYLVQEQYTLPKPFILMGDFNTTPWSNQFLKVKDGLSLSDSRMGFGLQPTWPVNWGPTHFSVPLFPIDHILTSRGICTVARKTGPDIASDHLPVLATLAVQ